MVANRHYNIAPALLLRGLDRIGDYESLTLMSQREVARRLSTSVRWVYEHATQLGGKRLSRRCVRFPESSVQRYLARQR